MDERPPLKRGKRRDPLNYWSSESRPAKPLARLWARLCICISLGNFAIVFLVSVIDPFDNPGLSIKNKEVLGDIFRVLVALAPFASLVFGIMAIIQAPSGFRTGIICTALIGILLSLLYIFLLFSPTL
jgi:hypothetical protein